jgi:hypothetical protein
MPRQRMTGGLFRVAHKKGAARAAPSGSGTTCSALLTSVRSVIVVLLVRRAVALRVPLLARLLILLPIDILVALLVLLAAWGLVLLTLVHVTLLESPTHGSSTDGERKTVLGSSHCPAGPESKKARQLNELAGL